MMAAAAGAARKLALPIRSGTLRFGSVWSPFMLALLRRPLLAVAFCCTRHRHRVICVWGLGVCMRGEPVRGAGEDLVPPSDVHQPLAPGSAPGLRCDVLAPWL
jgi:hypothetical protein